MNASSYIVGEQRSDGVDRRLFNKLLQFLYEHRQTVVYRTQQRVHVCQVYTHRPTQPRHPSDTNTDKPLYTVQQSAHVCQIRYEMLF